MRILITPMAADAPTEGPISRARAIAIEAKKRGHSVAFCAAEDLFMSITPTIATLDYILLRQNK